MEWFRDTADCALRSDGLQAVRGLLRSPAIQRSGWQAAMQIPREYTITAGRVHDRRKMAYGM